MTGHIDPTRDAISTFTKRPRKGRVHMLNMIRFRAEAAYPDGRKVTGREAYKTYARESGPVFARYGGSLFWLTRPELTVIGPPEETWDIIFVAEYPGVDAFLEMIRDPEYQKAVVHRQAAVEDSRLVRLEPQPAEKGFSFL